MNYNEMSCPDCGSRGYTSQVTIQGGTDILSLEDVVCESCAGHGLVIVELIS